MDLRAAPSPMNGLDSVFYWQARSPMQKIFKWLVHCFTLSGPHMKERYTSGYQTTGKSYELGWIIGALRRSHTGKEYTSGYQTTGKSCEFGWILLAPADHTRGEVYFGLPNDR
jgi:hypothetical protein